MNSLPYNPSGAADQAQFDETLRLIARLPAPQGLEQRLRAALEAQPPKAHVLPWPRAAAVTVPPVRTWMRGAAAAAIALTVLGGGWGIYSRVQPGMPAAAAAPRIGVNPGFSTAGAIRTPQTLQGPRVTPAAAPQQPRAAAPVEPGSQASAPLAKKSAAGRKAAAAHRPNAYTR